MHFIERARVETMIEHHEPQTQLNRPSIPEAQPTAFRSSPPKRAAVALQWHSVVWLFWLVAGVAAISTNPLLNMLIMAQAVLVASTCHTENPVGRSFGLFIRLGLFLVVVRTFLSAIPVGGFSYGGTPLFKLPELVLPIWLGGLRLGGTTTLEMIVGGFVSGMRLWALILVFGAFNAVADHYALLRRAPHILFHAGLATTIALTFVPQVVLQLQAIRDAQRVRGHRFRTWRDALPLIVPLLSGGLERSIQLAEAMDSRGYGRTTRRHQGTGWLQLLIIAAITLLALGLYAGFVGDWRGWIAATCGGVLTILMLRRLGSATTRTRYIRERWHRRDTWVALACVVVIFGVTLLRQMRLGGLIYTPLPRVSWPPFDPFVGALLLLLSVPAIIQLVISEAAHDRQPRLQHSPLADRTK